mmetsp:Transcript_14782/g.30510  ORF Transcript_14782/g.30510 Transcript_14782/m.30510 type:complete len:135 (+) Transcript_14782:1400-1804(+)
MLVLLSSETVDDPRCVGVVVASSWSYDDRKDDSVTWENDRSCPAKFAVLFSVLRTGKSETKTARLSMLHPVVHLEAYDSRGELFLVAKRVIQNGRRNSFRDFWREIVDRLFDGVFERLLQLGFCLDRKRFDGIC